MDRRNLITGLIFLVTAPAIVRASTLMRGSGERYFFWQFRAPLLPDPFKPEEFASCLGPNGRPYVGTWTFFGKDKNIYSDEQVAFRKEEMA